VFGLDTVLWVEGKTRNCVSFDYRSDHKRPVAGVGIIGLIATGDFETRHAISAFDVYRRLSEGSVLMPPGGSFSTGSVGERAVESLSSQRLRKSLVLPKKDVRNYLLNPEADCGRHEWDRGVWRDHAEAVRELLKLHRWNADLFAPGDVPAERTQQPWEEHVAGAAVLKRLFC